MEVSAILIALAPGEAGGARVPVIVPGTNPGTNDLLRYLNFWSTVVTPLADAATAAPGTSLLFARADHVHPSDTSCVAKAGDTMTGVLLLAADPVAALGAATKQYVDSRVGVTITTSAATYVTSASDAGDTIETTGTTATAFTINYLAGTSPFEVLVGNTGLSTITAAAGVTMIRDADGTVISGTITAPRRYARYMFRASSTTANVVIVSANVAV